MLFKKRWLGHIRKTGLRGDTGKRWPSPYVPKRRRWRGHRRNQPCQQLDLRLLASKIVRKYVSVHCSVVSRGPQLWGHGLVHVHGLQEPVHSARDERVKLPPCLQLLPQPTSLSEIYTPSDQQGIRFWQECKSYCKLAAQDRRGVFLGFTANSSPNSPPNTLTCGKIVFKETSPWLQKGWELLV